MADKDIYDLELLDSPPLQQTPYEFELFDAPQGQEDLGRLELFDEPPAQPVQVLPPRESAPGIPAPAEPEPVSTVDRQAEIMRIWGEQGRPRWPTPQDVQDTADIARKAYRGLQQAPFELSAGAQHSMAWLSEFFAQAAESPMPGAWAPAPTAAEKQQRKEFWRGLSKHFQETAKIPKEYSDAIGIIAQEEPGPEEVRQIFSSAGSVVPSLAVAPIGFPAMIAMAGLQSAGDNWGEGLQRRLDAGETEEQARENAVVDGLVGGIFTAVTTGAFGKTGIDSVVKAQANKATKGAIVAIAREFGWEGSEETVDEFLQIIWRKMRHDKMSLTDAIKYAVGPEGRKELALAGTSGGIFGATVGGAIQGDIAIREHRAAAQEYKEIADGIQQAIQGATQPQTGQATVRIGGREVKIPVPVRPDPVRGAVAPTLPTLPGTEAAGAVRQALSVGLPLTAQAAAAGRVAEAGAIRGAPAVSPPLSLTAGREPVPVLPPTTARGAVARETLGPEPGPTLTPGAPAPTVPPVAQPTQAERTTLAPPPGPVEGAPGVSPAPTSVTEPAPAPTPAPVVQSEEALGLQTNLERNYPHLGDRVEIIEDGEQFPESVKASLEARGLKLNDADAVPYQGRIIFNAKKFPVGDPDLVKRKVAHEAAIHLGLRAALGPEQFSSLSQSIWQNLNPEQRARIAMRNRISPTATEAIGEEWLAYEAERVVQAGASDSTWARIAAAIKQTLRRLGLRAKYSDLEIARMVSQGFKAIEQRTPAVADTTTRLSATPQYGVGHPLAQIDTIRYSISEVERAKLEGEREYSPEIINAGMEGAFDGVKKMLYIEAATLSDLIPPNTPWHQPAEGMSLIEYVRQFYSPEGIAAIRETFAGDRPPRFVQDKANWYRVKAELNAVAREGGPPGLGATFLATNRKSGGVSWDFGLGTCMPTENCSVCYAKGVTNPLLGTQARTRHALVTAMEPESVGAMIANYVTSKSKGDLPFLRINGSGDTTFPWQATAVNTLIQNLDRPVHVFSRSHVSRARGTIGLDSISNGQYEPGDVENGSTVYKMGSIDRQLVREYGIPFLKDNLRKRGIINSYLVKDTDDIPVVQELKDAGVFVVLHINRTNAVVNALREAGLIANEQNPELNTPSCYCALESGPFLNGCATCLVGGGPCFAMGSVIGMTPEGQMYHLDALLAGEIELPPNTRVVEMSRVGVPKDRAQMLADVAAKSYELAAKDLGKKIGRYDRGKIDRVIVENPRDRTRILIAENKAQVNQARQIVDDWEAYAKWLRGVVERFENSAGLHRYVARYEMEEALSLDEAMTEGVGAAARAVQDADPMFSITEGVPQPVHDIAQMTPAEFAAAAQNMEGGLTGEAVRVGRQVNTKEGIDKLREFQAAAQAESKSLMGTGDFDNAMAAASKAQFFREAMETATQTGSMAHAQKVGRIQHETVPATQPEEQFRETSKEGAPPGTKDTGKLLPPDSVAKVPEHDDDYLTRFSISPIQDPDSPPGTPIKNESMNRVLQELGLGTLSEALGKPDPELMRQVKERMDKFPHWVDSIIQREEKRPGMLSDEEVMALDYWMLELRTAIHVAARKAQAAEDAGNPTEAANYRVEVGAWGEALQRLGEITRKAGTETARAFRARQLATRWDFTLETLINEKRRAMNWEPLTQEEVAALEKKARDYEEKTTALEARVRELELEAVENSRKAALEEAKKVNPQVLEFATEWVESYRRRRKNATDRLKVKWQRAFPDAPLRASVTPGGPISLPDELMSELAIIGGSFLAENITEAEAWQKAMVDELGPNVRPYLVEARQAAEAHLTESLANARAEMKSRRAPRRAPGAAPAEPTLEEEIEVTKAKIHQVAQDQKESQEPVRSRQDDIFYPVQKLVRQLVEQDPFITKEELIAAVHQVLVDEFPAWQESETMDAISGRGRVRKPSQEALDKTIRDLRAQIRILAHIADTRARKPLPKTGFLQDEPSDEQRWLLEQLREAKIKHGEVVTNPDAQQKSYLDSRKTFYRNRIKDLEYEIANRRLIVRRSLRAEDTDPELEALKEEYRRTKAEHDQIFARPDLSDQERLEMAERAAERLIVKMEQDLAEGRKTEKGKRDPVASAKLEALRTRIVQLKAEQEWAQMALHPRPDLTDPKDIRRWFQLDQQIRKIQLQLATENVFTPKRRIREESPANQRLVEQLEDLKNQRQEMREQLRPTKLDPATRAINNRIAQLQRQIADFTQRIADQNFEPRKRKPTPTYVAEDPEVIRHLAERERIKKEFASELAKDRWKNMRTTKKIWHGIKVTRNAVTNLRSSFDFSALRQGMIALLSLSTRLPVRPIKTSQRMAKAFGQMFQAAFNTKMADRINEAIRQKPNWKSGAYKLMNLQFTDIEAPQFNVWEENARSIFDEWAKLPIFHSKWHAPLTTPTRLVARPVAGSNRAFATFLNVLRSELADAMLEENFKDRPPDANELAILGNYVNVATGRGWVHPRIAEGSAMVLWAPKLLMSRIQFLTGEPLWNGGNMRHSARARKIIAMEYARVLGSAFLLSMIARMFDEKKEEDPFSSDFGKIVRGNTRIDIWGGFQQMTTLLSRFMSGKTKTLKGRQIDLVSGKEYGAGDLGVVLWRFFRSKLRPDVGVAMDIATRRDFRGQPVTMPGVLEDLFVPLPFADLIPILKDRGFTEGMILEIMNQFGAGVNTYEDPKVKKVPYYPETRTQ